MLREKYWMRWIVHSPLFPLPSPLPYSNHGMGIPLTGGGYSPNWVDVALPDDIILWQMLHSQHAYHLGCTQNIISCGWGYV